MGKNFRETLNKELESPEFKEEWESLEAEYESARKIMNKSIATYEIDEPARNS